jgi:hypothetical protein
MKKENIPRIQEKLKYLLSISFKESQFEVLKIDVEIDDYTENENGDIEIFFQSSEAEVFNRVRNGEYKSRRYGTCQKFQNNKL